MIGAVLAVQLLAAGAPTAGMIADRAKMEACIAKIDQKPEDAYEDALAWATETHVREARMCQALALIAMKNVDAGARLLEALAISADGGADADRASVFRQAGNARLLNLQGAEAVEDFTQALKHAPNEPDLLIDRARAYWLTEEWRKAEEDLSAALDKRPNDSLILRLRATARLKLGVLDLAERDAEAAVKANPQDVDALLVRGQVREAKAGKR
jgi:tetratricopeptide (TPR) repeat protein